jgi:hypothetical protein
MSKSCEEEPHRGHNRSGSHVTGHSKTLHRFGIEILRTTPPYAQKMLEVRNPLWKMDVMSTNQAAATAPKSRRVVG